MILGICLMTVTTVIAQNMHIRARNFTTRDGLASNVVNCGLQDHQGYLWLGTNHGLTRFDGHRFVNFYVAEEGERIIEGIVDIAEDTERNVLLLSGRGYRLLCFDLTKMCFVNSDSLEFPKDTKRENIEKIIGDRANTLGIERGNKTKRRHDLHYVRLDDGRELFATIDNGLFVYEPESKKLMHFSANDEMPLFESDYINGMLKDRTGGVWLFTTFAGIYRLEFGEERILEHTLAPNIRKFVQLDNEHIAAADMNGCVYSYAPDSRESSIIFNNGIRVYALNTDAKGRLWIGTRGDGVWMDNQKLDFLPVKHIYDFKFSKEGTIWIASLDGGLIELHEKTFTNGQEPEKLADRFFFFQHFATAGIHELDIDLMGRLWMATEGGILRMDGTKVDTLFNKGKVVCICHSPNGVIWAGSNGHGLLKIDNDEVTFIQADNGLANNCVESVVCDSEGNVIAGTDQGISIINSTDGSVRNLYSQNGLRADTYNENAILRTDNGRLFLGSLTGLVELKHINMNASSAADIKLPAPCITSIDINDEPRYDRLNEEIHLSHNQNNLCFSFSSFAYQDLSTLVYSYWFEGIDHDWRPSTKESRALYTNLNPGHYRLHVRSRLAGTNWSEETVCDVYIAQPWYWTWWARVLYIVLFILFVLYELHQYQQRLSLRRQLDQRLAALYAVEAQQQQHESQEQTADTEAEQTDDTEQPTNTVNDQKEKAFIDKLDRVILENLLQTDLDVNFIAQEMCMSYSTLHRRIKSFTGMSANEYVRKHRLAKAMQMLREGQNATEVSMQCGFNSPSYFTRCFKAEYGILPSEVRG